jgi:hypothetical protein
VTSRLIFLFDYVITEFDVLGIYVVVMRKTKGTSQRLGSPSSEIWTGDLTNPGQECYLLWHLVTFVLLWCLFLCANNCVLVRSNQMTVTCRALQRTEVMECVKVQCSCVWLMRLAQQTNEKRDAFISRRMHRRVCRFIAGTWTRTHDLDSWCTLLSLFPSMLCDVKWTWH